MDFMLEVINENQSISFRTMIHVLKESVSPPESSIWTMHCGDQCIFSAFVYIVPKL